MKRSLMILLVVTLLVGTLAITPAHAAAPQKISLWFHSGQGAERDALNKILDNFDKSQSTYVADPVQLPEGTYDDQVNAGALANNLPCLLDFDGPNIYNYAWANYLIPLDKYISADLKNDILPTIIAQGTYNGHLYSLGTFDSGLAIWGNKTLLDKAGVKYPTDIKDAWTLAQFTDALDKLSKIGGGIYPIEFKLNYGVGEWYTFGFSPILQSFGGDLIDRTTYKSAEGVLNGPQSVAAMTFFQSIFTKKYADPAPANDTDFVNGKVALSYVGHWTYPDYSKALGANLVLIPMPKFGDKAVTGMGSWNWGITASCPNPDGAAALLNFLLTPDQDKIQADGSGAIPSRISVLKADPRYAVGGPLYVFYQQLTSSIALPRPQTAAYPTITSAFAKAVDEIVKGGDVQTALDSAVDTIDKDLKDHNYYAPGAAATAVATNAQ